MKRAARTMAVAGAILAISVDALHAGEKHSPAVKAKIIEAHRAAKRGDSATEKRLLNEALQQEPQSIQILRDLAGIARAECRWVDGLHLLKQARDLSRNKGEQRQIDESLVWVNTARLYASSGVYCGSPSLIKQPVPITRVEPEMPAGARLREGETKVMVWTEISPAGIPENLRALPTGEMGEFAAEALKAAARWRFLPATLDGKPVRTIVNIEVNFVVFGR